LLDATLIAICKFNKNTSGSVIQLP